MNINEQPKETAHVELSTTNEPATTNDTSDAKAVLTQTTTEASSQDVQKDEHGKDNGHPELATTLYDDSETPSDSDSANSKTNTAKQRFQLFKPFGKPSTKKEKEPTLEKRSSRLGSLFGLSKVTIKESDKQDKQETPEDINRNEKYSETETSLTSETTAQVAAKSRDQPDTASKKSAHSRTCSHNSSSHNSSSNSNSSRSKSKDEKNNVVKLKSVKKQRSIVHKLLGHKKSTEAPVSKERDHFKIETVNLNESADPTLESNKVNTPVPGKSTSSSRIRRRLTYIFKKMSASEKAKLKKVSKNTSNVPAFEPLSIETVEIIVSDIPEENKPDSLLLTSQPVVSASA